MAINVSTRNTYKVHRFAAMFLPDLFRAEHNLSNLEYSTPVELRNQRTGEIEIYSAGRIHRVRRDGSPIQPQSKLSAIAGEFNFKRGRLRRIRLEVEAFAKSVGAQADRPDIVHLFRYLDNLLVIQERQARSKLASTDQKKS